MSTQPTIEVIDLTEIVGEIEVPCDLGGIDEPCAKPAKWVMWTKDHGCGVHIRLACEGCKEARLMNTIAVECAACGHITADSCEAYSRIEAIS